MKNSNNKYDDIIGLSYPSIKSKLHPQMSLHDRAAQFAPFAALTGHGAAIKETARLTDDDVELTDEAIKELNEKLNILRENLGSDLVVQITYFVPDEKKSGGAYVTCCGIVRKIKEFEKFLIIEDDEGKAVQISFEKILEIEI